MQPPEPGDDRSGSDDSRFLAELRTALATASAARILGTTTPPERLLESMVRTAARAIPSPEGALFLVDEERQVLTFDVVIGSTAGTVRELTVPLGHGIAGLVAVSGQALAVANAGEDPRHARDVAERSGYLPTTILAVPVTTPDGTILGVLELLDRQEQPTYSLADMELLGAIAGQIAIVLEHRRAQASLGALMGRALSLLAGIAPAVERRIAEQTAAFASQVNADPVASRTQELAALVATITARGAAEHEACRGILEAFAGYFETHPAPGLEMDQWR